MKRVGKAFLWTSVVLVAVWSAGRLFLTVQLPDRDGRRDAFPDPLPSQTSLREAFDRLPDEGGENTDLRLLDDNAVAWLERWRLLESARRRLDICYFILKQDIFGMAFLGHLVKKAGDGVEIRVLLDAMGTKMSRTFKGNDYLDTLVETGHVSIRMYRPLPFRYFDAFLTLNPAAVFISNHDKILIADGRRVLIGGRNISGEYFSSPGNDPSAFRDTDVVISGAQIGAAAKAAFEAEFHSGEAHEVKREAMDLKDSTADLLLAYGAMDAWLHGRPFPPEMETVIRERDLPWIDELQKMPHLKGVLEQPLPDPVRGEVRLVDSRCRLVEADDFITRTLVRLVRSAQREIFIQSPYLVLPYDAVNILAEAAERGVRITILTNSPISSDNAMSQGVFLEQWPALLARVPTLQLFVAGDRHNLHGKIAVFDRQLVLVGTYNADPLSIALNSELVAAVWSEDFATEILRPREAVIGQGMPRVVQYRIGRDGKGNPRRDAEGEVVVEFGAADHIDPAEMRAVVRHRRMYRWVSKGMGKYPWY